MHGLRQPTPPHGELPRFSVEAFGAVHRALQRQYSETRPKTPCDFGSFEDACLHDHELQFRLSQDVFGDLGTILSKHLSCVDWIQAGSTYNAWMDMHTYHM